MGILSAMPDERIDPSQNTQAFQAWVDNNGSSQAAQPAATGAKLGFIVGGAVVAVALVVVVVLVLL
jgi:hypothetical protein